MKCRACGFENPPGFKFCGECATALTAAAREPFATPARADPRSYTPPHLAEKILTSRGALEGERKQVTVLFADVKGSMDLAEQVDPEVFHHVMERFAALLAEGVHRFEGTVTQFTGDGLMALFGAPIAHEDHAQRACYAALHLQEALRRYGDELRLQRGFNFAVRMGLNSGEVVVGTIGDDLRMDYTAQGHTVGLAARMEQIAEPGRVYVTGHTAALVHGLFRLRDLGPLTVKGVRDPLRVHELEGVGSLRTKLDVSRARGFSRFVGRDGEMRALEGALERALHREGPVIGIVAEPGVGKSRLCYEFAQRCRARGLLVLEAHGVAHGRNIPLLPILQLFRAYFGIAEQDEAQAAREKIAGRLVLLADGFREALPLVFDFLGVPDPERPVPRMDPEVRERRVLELVAQIARADNRPVVTLLEDLHWFDAGSEGLLDVVVRANAGTRGLVVVNFRPEYRAPWAEAPHYRALPLAPLDREASAALLAELLGTDASVAGLAERIEARTGGNPFFAEEVVQALAEAGLLEGGRGAYRLARPADEVAVPATVQAVLAARIDRLGARDKSVLQTAAVLGREFAEPILRRVSGLADAELAATLATLARAELVYEEQLFPHAEYVFKHPLTQEVAYRSQLADRRAAVHAAAAQAIAALYPEQLDERAALLAHHWEAAGHALDAARWHRRAAEWAGVRQIVEAAHHWRRVRELAEGLPGSPERGELALAACLQLMNAGWRLGIPEAEADALVAAARGLARQSGNPATEAAVVGHHASTKFNLGKLAEELTLNAEYVRLADLSGNPFFGGAARVDLALGYRQAGRLRDALAALDDARTLLGDDPAAGVDFYGGISPALNVPNMRAWVLMAMGRLVEAEAELARGEEQARRHGEMEVLCWLCCQSAELAWFSGTAGHALEQVRRATELAEQVGTVIARTFASLSAGGAHLVAGEWGRAIDLLEAALALGRERGLGLCYEAPMLAQLAEAHLGRGDLGRARALADEALAVARRREALLEEVQAEMVRSRALLRSEGLAAREKVENALRHASALIEQTGARGYAPFVHVERAALARLTGDETTRQRELRKAHRLFTEMGATARAEQVAKALAA